LIVVVTVGLGGARQAPVPGFVSQIAKPTGKAVAPVSADAMIPPPAPTFTVATAKTPDPSVPAMFTMPSLSSVAANAMMSGTGVDDAERSTVLRPGKMTAGGELAHVKLNCTSVGGNGAVGVKAST
jgi:hypothetical protein